MLKSLETDEIRSGSISEYTVSKTEITNKIKSSKNENLSNIYNLMRKQTLLTVLSAMSTLFTFMFVGIIGNMIGIYDKIVWLLHIDLVFNCFCLW